MRCVTCLCLLLCCVGTGTLAAQAPSSASGGSNPSNASNQSNASNAANQGVLAALPALPSGSLVALLPPAGTDTSEEGKASADEAVQAVSDALHGKGYRVLAPSQVSAALSGHTPDGCRNPATCDPQLALATLEADAVVSIAVWQRPGWPSQVAIHVRRTRGYGQAEMAVEAAGLAVAASTALSAALDDSRHTHEVVVRIESQPSGAHLQVDQTLSATTPARILLLPGSHLVSAEAPGYVTSAQYVDVPERPKESVLVRMQLRPAALSQEAPGPQPTLAQRERAGAQGHGAQGVRDVDDSTVSAWNYVASVALFGAAVPLLANVIHAALTRGECVGEIDPKNRCGERVVLGPAFFASIALASIAVAGGTTFLVVRPIASGGSSEPRGAMVQLQRAF